MYDSVNNNCLTFSVLLRLKEMCDEMTEATHAGVAIIISITKSLVQTKLFCGKVCF